MKKLSVLLFFFLSSLFASAQLATFDWRVHVSFTNPSAVVTDDKTVLCAFENGLLEYDIHYSEVDIWSYTNGLSDVKISTLFYDKASDSYWVGYENGNIDKIHRNTVYNLPYLKLANIVGSKKINSFYAHNGNLYAISDFGILVINPVKNEIKETLYTNNDGLNNLQTVILQDSIYVLTEKALLKAHKNNPILADYGQWELVSSSNLELSDTTQTTYYSAMTVFNNQLLIAKKTAQYEEDTVFVYQNGSLNNAFSNTFEIENLQVIDNQLFLVQRYGIAIYNTDWQEVERFYQYQDERPITGNTITKATNGEFFIGDREVGLTKFKSNWSSSFLSPSGPSGTAFYRVNHHKDQLIFSAGRISKMGANFNQGQLHTLKNNEWNFYSIFNQELLKDMKVWDFNGVAIHPKDENTFAFSACGRENSLFIVRDGKQVSEIYGINNSLIELREANNLSCISDIQYDKKGNLWILNMHADYPLKVLTKDGVFYEFDTGSQTRQRFVEKLVIDDDGNPWFTVLDVGVVGYFTNGTIEDPSDDSYKILNKGENTGALPNNEVTDIVVGKDGRIWFTTTEGFSILSNPAGVANAQYGGYNTYRPKIEYGADVEYFLGKTSITCGIVDGGNRKWLGTDNAGLFCLAEDGYSIVYEFNQENSKLISNTIYDLAFNNKTGELFVLTDLGLESIRTDASDGRTDYKDVIVFPNPVNPEFEGVITIQGIKTDSDIKITDAAGNLVYKTNSNGGTAIWDGRKVNGEKVATGVYLIWTAPNNGKGQKVGKVTIIN